MPARLRHSRHPPGRMHVRVLDLASGPAASAGPSGEAAYLRVRWDGVPKAEAVALEREVREAECRSDRLPAGMDGGPGRVGLIVSGSLEQIRTLAGRLRRSDAGAAELADALETALGHRFQRGERVIRGLHRSFTVGGRTLVMGVVNVTPDSFSDGGRFLDPGAAEAQSVRLASEGAAILDIGGESTRPGASRVTPEAEWRRVGPVLARLRGRVEVPISIDTRRPEVAVRALSEGADLVNDVSGLRDPAMRRLVARSGAPAIVMHMRGEPATMQANVEYSDLVSEVYDDLSDACARAEADGIAPSQLLIDPGLGFGKAPPHNLELIARLGEFRSLGPPIVLGASRKSFLGWALGGAPLKERAEAGLAASVAAALRGADIVRVHDVRPTVRALAIADRLRALGPW